MAGGYAYVPKCSGSVSFLVIQPFGFSLPGGDQHHGKRVRQQERTAFAIVFQNIFAYAITLMIYQIGLFATGGGFGVWTAISGIVLIGFLYLLFRPNPYKKKAGAVSRAAAWTETKETTMEWINK